MRVLDVRHAGMGRFDTYGAYKPKSEPKPEAVPPKFERNAKEVCFRRITDGESTPRLVSSRWTHIFYISLTCACPLCIPYIDDRSVVRGDTQRRNLLALICRYEIGVHCLVLASRRG